MFGGFRRYQKVIWALVIIALIPGLGIFLWVGDDLFSSGGSRPKTGNEFELYGKLVTIGGRPVTQEEVVLARNELMLAYFIRSQGREWPQENDRFIQEAIFRVFMIQKLQEMQVEVSETAVAKLARSRLGNFPYREFERQILQPKGLSSRDFERYALHETQIQQLVPVASLEAKLVTPTEAELFYRRENQEVAVEVATFWSTNYLDKVEVTPEAVGQFYTNQQARYRVPERMTVTYVEFPATNFLVEAEQQMTAITNLESQIEELYIDRGTNSFKDTNGVMLSAETAKNQIRDEIRQHYGLRSAHQKANELGMQLAELPEPKGAGDLERLAAALGHPVKVSPPFRSSPPLSPFDTADEEPVPDDMPEAVKEAARALSKEKPLSVDPIRAEKAVYLIALKDTIPSSMKPFEEVEAKAIVDFREFEASKLARSDGTNFYAILTNGLAQGKTFSELTAQEKVKVVSLPPFSVGSTNIPGLDPRLDLTTLQRMVPDMERGETDRFRGTRDGGFIVYLRDRLPLDEAKMRRELPNLVGRLRQYRQAEAFSQWFNKQAEQARLVIPRAPAPEEAPTAPSPPTRPSAAR